MTSLFMVRFFFLLSIYLIALVKLNTFKSKYYLNICFFALFWNTNNRFLPMQLLDLIKSLWEYFETKLTLNKSDLIISISYACSNLYILQSRESKYVRY